MLQLSNSQKWILHSCVAFHNVFVPGKRWGRGCRKRDKLERSHFFSITIARLQGHHSQWVVHGDAPSRKRFNYGLLACVQEGAGALSEAGKWEQGFQSARFRKGMPRGGYNVITIINSNCNNAGVGLLVVHKQAIPSGRHSCWPPSHRSSRRKKSKI